MSDRATLSMNTSAAIDAIEAFLFSEAFEESALDFFGLGGAVAAQVVCSRELKDADFWKVVVGSEAEPHVPKHVSVIIENSKNELQRALEFSENAELALSQVDSEEALKSWCQGFCEVILALENATQSQEDEVTAELLLPFFALSGYLDDEAEFSDLKENDGLFTQFADELDSLIVDLYLHFHADSG